MNTDEKLSYFLREIDKEGEVNPKALFREPRPVYLEIGCGKGEFIAEASVRHQEANFLGVELKARRIVTIVKKLDWELNGNVKLLRNLVDTNFLNRLVPESLTRVYIFHPDPWPKRKHFKKRLIQVDFLEALYRVLIPGGEVYLSTDFQDYAMWIVDHFKASPKFKTRFPDGYSREPFAGHIETYFEAKHRKLGAPPYYINFMRD